MKSNHATKSLKNKILALSTSFMIAVTSIPVVTGLSLIAVSSDSYAGKAEREQRKIDRSLRKAQRQINKGSKDEARAQKHYDKASGHMDTAEGLINK